MSKATSLRRRRVPQCRILTNAVVLSFYTEYPDRLSSVVYDLRLQNKFHQESRQETPHNIADRYSLLIATLQNVHMNHIKCS